MWAHSLKSTMLKSIDLSVRSLRGVLGGISVLIVLLLMLPSIAFAAASSSSSAFASIGTQRNVDQAGVSVVRLIVTYTSVGNLPTLANTSPSSPQTNLQCTGLGVLISSSSDSTGNNVWVLTDGTLVNPSKLTTCNTGVASLPSATKLTQIEVLASNEYTNNAPAAFIIGTLAVKPGDVTCENTTACDQGVALFRFSPTTLQPYIDLAQTTPATAATQGIGLVNPASNAPASASLAQQYLTPQVVSSATATVESGMPLVDSNGALVGMHLSNGSTAPLSTITPLITTAGAEGKPGNALHDNWDSGIAAFYSHNYTAAQTDFQKATTANPQFKAATAFKNLAFSKTTSSGKAGTGTSSGNSSTSQGNKSSTIFGLPTIWVFSFVALILLVVILLLVSQIIRRRSLAGFSKDEASAASRADVEARRIAVMEAQQRQGQQSASVAPAPIGMPGMNAINGQMPPPAPLPMMGAVPQAPVQMSPARDLSCPNCGHPVPFGAPSCPNCHTRLALTDSKLHLRVHPQQGGAGTDLETTLPLSPQPQPQPQFPLPSVPSYAQSMPPYPVEHQLMPTMSPDSGRNGQDETEKKLPFNIRQVGNNNLGLVVGTQTNPGIKRKHKPNEDSVFAAQGAGMFNASPQPFGLFVVADGMGGHANGQDASRLAIQTIINYLLPRLEKGEDLDRNALTQLLVEGVQQANQAVFQHNLEQRADMGTTMTSALVVGASAIVANVGDSRTYLYREPQGLTKVTNDHSVVASLVEAGIIKPDDIYTHPKRNQIYRSLGEKPAVEVDSFVVDLLPGDKLLLCSDGLWDMVRDPNIQQLLRNAAPTPDQTGEALIQAALNGGGEDNVSVIVVYVTDTNQATGISGLKLLTKPETVQMPQM